MNFDVAIIGGGPSGLMSAICIKRKKPAARVCVIEALDRVCKKLIITGNGRCNITNKNASLKNYHGGTALAKTVFDRFFVDDTVEFFKSLGVDIVFEADGRAYPASYQASSVVDALRLTCDELGVKTLTDCAVTDIKRGFCIMTVNGNITAQAVIVTGGLLSGGKKIGSDGSVLGIIKRMGLKTVPVTPAIVQLKTDTVLTRRLKGIKVNADVSLVRQSRVLRREYGEVLFTDYGLSGPPILQVSRDADTKTRIILDLAPSITKDELLSLLYYKKQVLSKRTADTFLSGFLNKRVGQEVLKECGLKLTDTVSSINCIEKIADKIKALPFDVTGNTGFVNSQVSTGGVDIKELDDELQCKKYANMFFAGEIIDIDGDCGGYNLQWAWSSAYVAADGALKCL